MSDYWLNKHLSFMQSAGFLVRSAANSSLATHASEPRVSPIELTRLAPMQVTHASIAEVGNECFQASDWRGCIKAGLPPSPSLLSAGLLRISRASLVTQPHRAGLLTDGLVGSSVRICL
jgi:hypothetical protein